MSSLGGSCSVGNFSRSRRTVSMVSSTLSVVWDNQMTLFGSRTVTLSTAAKLVDYAEDIDPAWLSGVSTVGVTSGASVPEVLVRGVLDRLAEYGYGTVQSVTTANETLVFALPREIRPARA